LSDETPDSRKLRSVDISERKLSVAGDGTLNMSRIRGTPFSGYDASEKIWEYACGARCKNVDTKDDKDETGMRESRAKEGLRFGGSTSFASASFMLSSRALLDP